MKTPNLRAWREARGHSQRSLAREANLNHFTVLRAERGEDIRPTNAAKIAAALGVEVADLMAEKDRPPAPLKVGAPQGSGQQRKVEELADVPDSMEELLERSGAATRHLADENLTATIDDKSLEDARKIVREVLVEYNAVVEELALVEQRFPHATTKITNLLGEAIKQLIMARFALRARTGVRLVRIEPTTPTQRSEGVPEIEELDRALAMATS